jgi:5-dehydro-2-deoxygluconokinase
MFITNGTNLAAEPSRSAALEALKATHEAGVKTIFDVDFRASSWANASQAGEQARRMMPFVNVVLANEEELSLLTSGNDPQRQIEQVLHGGVEIVVQKLGARGVAAHTLTSHDQADSLSEKLVCAVGGGDGFASGFLYALYRGFDLPRALSYGNAAAAVVVSRVSCSDVMPRLQEIENQLKSNAAPAV